MRNVVVSKTERHARPTGGPLSLGLADTWQQWNGLCPVLDLGNTVVRDLAEDLFPRLAEAVGLDLDEVEHFWKYDLWPRFAHINGEAQLLEQEMWDSFADRFSLAPRSLTETAVEITERCIEPLPHMLDLLERLAQTGIPIALCSNQSQFWAERILRRTGLCRHIPRERMVWSFEVGQSKSSAGFEMFHAVVRAVPGFTRDAYLLIDDRHPNITQALAFGWAAVRVEGGSVDIALYLERLFELLGAI